METEYLILTVVVVIIITTILGFLLLRCNNKKKWKCVEGKCELVMNGDHDTKNDCENSCGLTVAKK